MLGIGSRAHPSSEPAVLNVAQVSDGFFELFGVRAQHGRLLTDQDHNADDRVVVISDRLWRSRFASDPGTVGRSLTLDHQEYTVAGVAARGFAFPEKTDVWLPFNLTAENRQSPV